MYAGEVGVSDWKTNPDEDMPAEVRTIRCLQKLEIVRPRPLVAAFRCR